MEEIDEFLGINNGIENMRVDEQVNVVNNRAGLLHGIVNDQQNDNPQLVALNVGAGNQPNNLLPIEPPIGNDGLGGLNQNNIDGQRNAGDQGDAAAGDQLNIGIPINQQRGNAGAAGLNQANIEGQRNASNERPRLPQGNAANVRDNNLTGGNHIQGDNQGIRQENRPDQRQNGQQRAGGILRNINNDQRTHGRPVVNRNRNPRSAPYNPNAARLRTRNYNNLAQLLMSMAKQGAYVPAHQEQDENDEEAQ